MFCVSFTHLQAISETVELKDIMCGDEAAAEAAAAAGEPVAAGGSAMLGVVPDEPAALEAAFTQAVADSKQLPERPDNRTLLQIYALYKQASEGDACGEANQGCFEVR